jgi:hypothetical protein
MADGRLASKPEIIAASDVFRFASDNGLNDGSCHEREKTAAGLRTRRRFLTSGVIRSPQILCRSVLNKKLPSGALRAGQ